MNRQLFENKYEHKLIFIPFFILSMHTHIFIRYRLSVANFNRQTALVIFNLSKIITRNQNVDEEIELLELFLYFI